MKPRRRPGQSAGAKSRPRRCHAGSSSQRSQPQAQEPYQYLIFHKPYDVLSQFTDRGGDRATLKDYVPVPGVYPVGRLDRDSEGLLLLTNDGPLQHRLSSPQYGHPRTYWVQVERVPNEAALDQLRQGVVIQTQRTRPAEVQLLPGEPPLPPRHPPIRDRKTVSTCWLALTLREGRNRQVRRMTAAVGHPTLRLVRVAIGPLQLGDLPLGKWRSLTPEEVQSLHQLCRSGRSPR
jgi:23S rRNA pseudouridine2457 synthase